MRLPGRGTRGALALLALSTTAAAGDLRFERAKLVPPDGVFSDHAGEAVAADGTIVAVGVPRSDEAGEDSGSVWLFDATTGQPLRELLADDAAAGDGLGTSVAIDGSIVAAGAPEDDDLGAGSGSVYLFDVATGDQVGKLLPDDGGPGDEFGSSVALRGTTLLVGAERSGAARTGAAYVFDVATRQQGHKLLADDGDSGDRFGRSVAFDGDVAAVGAWSVDVPGTNTGAAYVFDLVTGAQTWRLASNDLAAGDQFGISVGVEGTTVVVGANQDDDNGTWSGSAYLFDAVTGTQLHKLLPGDGATFARFGANVAIDAGQVLAGATGDAENGSSAGAAYLFDVATGQETDKLLGSDADEADALGDAIALRDGLAVAGAPDFSPEGTRIGAAYLFDAVVETPGTPSCPGISCPCGNDDPQGLGGCANSSGRGAVLCASGTASVAADDLTLTVFRIPSPNANGLFFTGPSLLPPFTPSSADGHACTGGGLRFPGILDDGPAPYVLVQPTVVGAAASGGLAIAPGETWHFQAWTRDNHGSPCGGASNLSNAWSVTFVP